MKTIKPKKLQKGDTIGIISLCGDIKDKQNIYNAQKYFETLGYNTVLSKNIFDKKRYLAGEDTKKLDCLYEFFEDSDINAIICSRGGYGAIRLINKLDYEIIRNNPKIFAGYSDVTAFSTIFYKKTGLISFSAPMAKGDFGTEEISEFTVKNFFDALTKNELEFKLGKKYYDGEMQGTLIGGNLATITSLCGIDFIPDEKFIFFAEDLNENDYKIDKMFTQLLNIEKFRNNLAGIVLGEFLDVSNYDYLDELFYEIGEEIKKPVIGGLKVTHSKDKVTVPVGTHAILKNNNLYINDYLS